MNLELILRIESNIKLNLFKSENPEEKLIPEHKLKENEVHFLKIEGIKAHSDPGTFGGLLKIKTSIGLEEMGISDWTITDLDDHLKGNPHINE